MARRSRDYVAALGLAGLLAACSGSSTAPSGTAVLALATASVSFSGQQGAASPPAQAVAVTNSGGGTVAGLSVGTTTYGAGASGWLTTSLSGTATPTILTLTATTSTLVVGTYTATVPVVSSTTTNSPRFVTVTLNMSAGGALTTLTAAGQSAVFLASPSFNTQLTLQAGSQYLVAVVNTDTAYTVTEDFALSGSLATGSPSASNAPVAAAPRRKIVRFAPEIGPRKPTYTVNPHVMAVLAALRRLTQNHLKMLDLNRQTYARFGNPRTVRTRLEATGVRVSPLSASVTQAIGAVNKIYVKQTFTGSCTDVDSIGARTVAIGQHVIVLADTSLTRWPQSARPDSSFYQTFANEYDQLTWPHILTNIGNPLAYDAELSGVDKVTVTITPVLNNFGGGIVAFVNGCDFYPFAPAGLTADFSNHTEMFYYWVAGSEGYTVSDWENLLRGTAAHETKHIVSYTDRIMNDSPVFEQIWLEEGLAQESSEIWERHFNQATWKGNANFAQTVACELDLGADAPCDSQNDKPYVLVSSHLPFLFSYLEGESQSNAEGLGKDTYANYGAGWTIARWATDQYASTEASFIQALIDEPTLNGLPNLSSHTGQSIPLLLVYWNLATAIYDTATYVAADPRTTIPSFNFGNIFFIGQTGLTCGGTPCGLFSTAGTPVYPIQPIALSAGSFNQAVHGVPGTAASFFLLSAPSGGTETLQLESGSGGQISSASGFRVGIVRVE